MNTFFFLLPILLPLVLSQRDLPRPGGDESDDGFQPSGCCDWPSCYDPRTELCLDSCLGTWAQCPARLTLMTCYSEYISPFGSLPLQCFPDVVPHIDQAEARGIVGPAEKESIPYFFTFFFLQTFLLFLFSRSATRSTKSSTRKIV